MPSQYVFGSQGPKGPGKPLLTADTTFYLRQDGNDTQTGAADNIGEAWKTLQHAFDWVAQNVSCNGYVVTFQLADGSYAGYVSGLAGVYAKPDGVIYLHGNATNPENVIITSVSFRCIGLAESGPAYPVYINNVTFQGNSAFDTGVACVYSPNAVTLGASLNLATLGTIRFTGQFRQMVYANFGASIEIYGTVKLALSANFTQFAIAEDRGFAQIGTDVISMDIARSFTNFITASFGADTFYSNSSEIGTFTGRKYSINSNSVLRTFSTVPGTVAGVTATGGQVV